MLGGAWVRKGLGEPEKAGMLALRGVSSFMARGLIISALILRLCRCIGGCMWPSLPRLASLLLFRRGGAGLRLRLGSSFNTRLGGAGLSLRTTALAKLVNEELVEVPRNDEVECVRPPEVVVGVVVVVVVVVVVIVVAVVAVVVVTEE